MDHTAILVCSESACAQRAEVISTLEELETLVCDCGCGLLLVGWPEPVGAGSLALVAG